MDGKLQALTQWRINWDHELDTLQQMGINNATQLQKMQGTHSRTNTGAETGGAMQGKPVLESKAVSNPKVMANDRADYQEWVDNMFEDTLPNMLKAMT